MAINIKFDLSNNPEPPTIILANRNGNKLGQLDVNVESIDLSDKFNDASEFSFTLNKYSDKKVTNLWDKVVDFKLVYCKEWDMWFEIKVELDEATETVKTVFCTQLGQAELSQIMLYNIEINTEDDIARDDYKITILYDENDPKASLLNRTLEKAPHYRIAYVDPTIARIQRSFSFDGTSIFDVHQEIAEEIGCLFDYPSNSDENGKIKRDIYVYDLQQNCNDCGHRGEFTDVCPECGSTNIKNGYGKDTLIFVTSDELASDGIQLVTDTDSVKNCFKLEAGDDLMTATVRNCNPNGTDYIWYFSDDIKEDMSDELVKRIEDYNDIYKDYYNNYESNIDANLLNKYNLLIDKYSVYKSDLQKITTPIKGYANLMNAYYNVVDMSLYLKSGLMPSVEISDTNAQEQVKLLTASSLSPVGVGDVTIVSLATADSAVLAIAKIIVKSTYKVEIKSSELIDEGNAKYWQGKFVVTNYSDEEDTAESSIIGLVKIVDNDETIVKQKIDKALNKENTDDLSISGLFEKEYNDFCKELKKYALNPLISFRDACQACIDIMIEQGVADGDTWADTDEGAESNLYEKLYIPYYNKLMAIESEIKIREDEINIISGVYDLNGNLVTDGLQSKIEESKTQIQDALDFENYLGDELWLEFCSYRREDKYSNENYISDGLNNAELFKKANEFLRVAEDEIYKSAELQHSISTTLNNLLAIEKFKLLVDSFNLGNWIRVQVDGKVYKLRLLEYNISYGDFATIPVEFSDVTKVKNGITDVKDILEQASSMASSYSYTQKQAEQGNVAQETIGQWLSNGLNSALVQIQNNENEEITLSKSGLLGRSYSDITGTYSPEQFKLTHNIFAYTNDNWKTVSSALGKHNYKYWNGTRFVDDEDYGLSTKFVTAGYVTGSQIIGGEIVSSNYVPKKSGTYFNLIDGDFEFAGGKIVFDTNNDSLTLKDVSIQWDSTNAPEVTVNDVSGLGDYLDQLGKLEDQLDGRVQTYSQSTDPKNEWVEDEDGGYENHIGDLWFNPDDGSTKRWNGNSWDLIEDSGLIELAQSKAQIFVDTPTTPYYVGDLWVQGSTGDILHCINSKGENESYNESDWVKSSKYTDDTVITNFIEGEYANSLDSINKQIDGKARSWYQDTDPSLTWDTNEDHEGDLWYNSSTDSQVTCIYTSGAWKATQVPKELFDTIDGIASIYVTVPSNPVVGDLLIPTSDSGTYKSGKVYKYSGSVWVEINYTDDTRANEAYALAQAAQDEAKTAIKDAAQGISLANNAQSTANDANTAAGNAQITADNAQSTANSASTAAENAQTTAENAHTRAETAETNAKDYADNKDKDVLNNANSYADAQDKSLSDTLTNAYKEYTDSEVGKLDKAVGDYLGWDGKTIIDDKYMISPYIGGGYLNITKSDNTARVLIDPNNLTGNNYIFQVQKDNVVTVGIDSSGNAVFNGAITATSLTLMDGVSLPSNKVDGLSSVATSGSYSDLSNQPTIPDKVSQLTNDSGYQTSSQVTTITKNTVTTSYVNALNVHAASVDAENITGTSITGKSIVGGSILIGDKSKTYAEITSNGVLNCNGATISGNFQQYSNTGYKSVGISDNEVKFYSWETNGDYVGSIKSLRDNVNTSMVGIGMFADAGDNVWIGYRPSSTDNTVKTAIGIFSSDIENGKPPFIVNTKTCTLSPITALSFENGRLKRYNKVKITVVNGLITDYILMRYDYNEETGTYDESVVEQTIAEE